MQSPGEGDAGEDGGEADAIDPPEDTPPEDIPPEEPPPLDPPPGDPPPGDPPPGDPPPGDPPPGDPPPGDPPPGDPPRRVRGPPRLLALGERDRSPNRINIDRGFRDQAPFKQMAAEVLDHLNRMAESGELDFGPKPDPFEMTGKQQFDEMVPNMRFQANVAKCSFARECCEEHRRYPYARRNRLTCHQRDSSSNTCKERRSLANDNVERNFELPIYHKIREATEAGSKLMARAARAAAAAASAAPAPPTAPAASPANNAPPEN